MSNIKKVQKDKLAKLKYLSNWLKTPNKDISPLVEDEKEFNQNIKYRLFSYFLNDPKICFYLNTYLNDFYDFVSTKYTAKEWLLTFAKIIQLSNVRNLWINKFQNLKRNQFTKLIEDYCHLINEAEFNQAEVNNFFLLFEYNIIPNNYIEKLQASLNIKESANRNTPTSTPIITNALINSNAPKKINPTVVEFCDRFINNIQNRNQCKYCPGYKRGVLVLEGTQYENLDVLILGNYPSDNDIRNQEFLSKHTQFKNYLTTLFDNLNISYAFSNRILCSPSNKEDDTIKKMATSCSGFGTLVHDVTKAKLKIILGVKAAKLYGIKCNSKHIGSIVDGIFLFPDLDEIDFAKPKEVARLNEYAEKFEKIINYKNNEWSKDKPNSVIEINEQVDTNLLAKIPTTVLPPGCSLFDIQILKGNVIYIIIDSNGKKQYINNNITYPIYIKKGKFNECEFIDSKMDFIAYLSMNEKQILSQKLNDNLKKQIMKTNTTDDSEEDITENFSEYEEMF